MEREMKPKEKTVKYSKAVGRAEIASRRLHNLPIILPDGTEIIEPLKKSAYELKRAYPELFDGLFYICSFPKLREHIMNQGDDRYTHFRINKMPIDVFFEVCQGDSTDRREYLKNELYRLIRHPEGKVLPGADGKSILIAQPIIVSMHLETGEEVTPKYIENLKGSQGKPIAYISIEFYKPLFERLLIGEHGEDWFSAPSILHTRLNQAIESGAVAETQGFPPVQFRRLFVFLNIHSNDSEKIRYKAIDLALACSPHFIQNRKGKSYIKNISELKFFVSAGLKLFNYMAQISEMDGAKTVPLSLTFDKRNKEFVITFHRRDSLFIPAFTDKTTP
jgi:hypothetical protein